MERVSPDTVHGLGKRVYRLNNVILESHVLCLHEACDFKTVKRVCSFIKTKREESYGTA